MAKTNRKIYAYRMQGKLWKHDYERFLSRRYTILKARCKGTVGPKEFRHLWKGKDYLDKDRFMLWAKSIEFFEMYRKYLESGKNRNLIPTVDRIDSSKGYVLGNMQWATLSENCKRARMSGVTNKSIFSLILMRIKRLFFSD
jgi:hypothetical protein